MKKSSCNLSLSVTISVLIFHFLAVLSAEAHPQRKTSSNSTPPSVEARKISSSIRIDGRLDEPEWLDAAVISSFVQREPQEGAPVSERTESFILYDEKHLYIGFRCWDREPRRIVANEMRRDIPLQNNDSVTIFLDTYHDNRTAFCFSTNPLGAQRDGVITADLSEEEQNWEWNGVWVNASRIDEQGWTAEIAIPFRTLRFHGDDDQVWGINLARFIPRKREEAFWSPILRDYGWWGIFRVSSYGHLTGLRGLKHPGKWEVKPYVLAGVQNEFSLGGPYEKRLDFGVDAKFHLTSNLTADLSLNTDFAQVEADQEQVNLTRFELFFPEKRDFFLEAADTFRFGERRTSPVFPPSVFFFSRRIGLSEDNEIVPLLGGVKMTGQIGGFKLGFLDMVSERTNYVNDDEELVFIPRTNFTVLRAKRDILANSYIGIIGLNKESLDDNYFNRGFGLDTNIYLNQNTQVSGFVAKTLTPGMAGKDLAAYGDFTYNDDFWTILLSQNTIQDNFNPEMGFFPRTGIRKTTASFGISPRPGVLNIRQLALFNDFTYITDQSGRLETRTNFSGLFSIFQNGATWFAFFVQNYEWLDEEFEIYEDVTIPVGTYRFNNIISEFESDKSKPISTKVFFRGGEFYDGNILGFGLGPNIKLGSRLTLNLLWDQNNIKLPQGNFSTTILSTRIVYTFSPRLFVKAFIQWNSEEKALLGNFLLSFIHTPGSDLFLVYNEELSTEGGAFTFRKQNRAILLKFNYLFNF